MPIFATAVFLSAFLLFALQPMVAKFLLPTFGGTAAVWATCLVFFQMLLLAGYAYAHLLRTRLSPIQQRFTHAAVLVVALLFLPPAPHVAAEGGDSNSPVWTLLRALLTSVGVPFFALSATAPLLMEWHRQSAPEKSVHRLYAYSNAGSLLALVGYPLVIEPGLSRGNQALAWAIGAGIFTLVCGFLAWQTRNAAAPTELPPELTTKSKPPASPTLPKWLWIALPACGSGLLLALTNQISQDVAPMPLLWVAPMSVYLLTFVLCFESQRTYQRQIFIPAAFLSLLLLAWLISEGYLQGFWPQIGGYLSVLFVCCMVCHGELYRLRPPASQLTSYYLAMSLGGALGGVFVALIAPVVFKMLLETPLIAIAIPTLATFILWREKVRAESLSAGWLGLIGTVVIALSFTSVLQNQYKESVCFARNFYGVYRVTESPLLLLNGVRYPLTPGPARVLHSGQIYHGLQFTQGDAAKMPTTYYCEEGGLGVMFRELPVRTNRNIGAVGLGAGTLAAYGQPGDRIRFYELSPEVLRLARAYFSFLTNCPAQLEVILGDGRLSLEREADQNFDLLVLDAFAGDSIPAHLLTEQAMKVYMRHLKPGGVMAFHISNSHLNLVPVVRALAEKNGLTALSVPPGAYLDPRSGKLESLWMVLSANEEFLNGPIIRQYRNAPFNTSAQKTLLWTDDYSSILPILH